MIEMRFFAALYRIVVTRFRAGTVAVPDEQRALGTYRPSSGRAPCSRRGDRRLHAIQVARDLDVDAMFAAVVAREVGDPRDDHFRLETAAFLHDRHIDAFRVVAHKDDVTFCVRALDGAPGVVEHVASCIAAARDQDVMLSLNVHRAPPENWSEMKNALPSSLES